MRAVLILFVLLSSSITLAQSRYVIGTLPTININKKLENNWQLNSKFEFRQTFGNGVFGDNQPLNYEYVHTDASLVVSKKTGLNNKLAGGLQLRFTDTKTLYRGIQQFTIVNRFNNYRLGHRFTADETFAKNKATTFRLRYRITFDIPLNGQNVDANEWYLKISNEYLNIFESNDYDLELRAIPVLGYVFNDNNKLECGIDYRIDSFINNNTRQRFWLAVNWYIRL